MKIVINTCYGGFGVSREAFLKLREQGNQAALDEPDIGEHYSDGSGPRESFGGSDSFGREIPRDDPQLAAIVESMGEDANSRCSSLTVVEIPDNVEWQVEEYDGSEWVAEKHRTWP